MIIDSHEHVMNPAALQVDKMEAAGVNKVILFPTTPHPEKAKTYTEFKDEMGTLYKILAGENTKEANRMRMEAGIEEVLQSIKQSPDRFYGFGSVPLGLTVDETSEWIETHIAANGLKGIGEFTPGSEEQIRELATVFQALENFPQFPIWVHTFDPVTAGGIEILKEHTKKHPKINVIYGHMGGNNWMSLLDFAKTVPNAYLDTSAVFSTLAARMAISELPERCLYSSDCPYGEPELSRQLTEFVSPSKEVARLVLGENIAKLLQL